MKRNRRRLPAPQVEFEFAPLFSEITLDGERIARERAQVEHARKLAESSQAALFTTRQSRPNHT